MVVSSWFRQWWLWCAFLILTAGVASAQLRIVDYNTAGDARAGMNTVLAALGAESVNGVSKAPDVFALQEQDSSASTTQDLVNLLNGIYGAGTYARATMDGGTSGAGRPGLIYNVQTVQLVATTTASTVSTAGAARQTMRYELRPVGYDETADFYVYVSHYKASSGGSNAARRNAEALQVRANADALGEGAHILYAGDFNIYNSSEAMWGTLTGAGAGQAFDPINRVGSWSNNAAFKDVHTQSPATTSRYGGQVTGGMDDRFDYQLVSNEFLDGEGLSYLEGSYHAFGNTGTHTFNGDITSGSAAALQARLPGYSAAQASAVLEALAAVSDHLPVVAQYQLPAKMKVDVGAVPERILIGASAEVGVTITNVAPVVTTLGADELDYVVSAEGALAGGGTGQVLALTPGDRASLRLASDTLGVHEGSIEVHSDSPQAADRDFSTSVTFSVVDHAQPAFASQPDFSTLALDFGEAAQFSGPITLTFSLANAAPLFGERAGLDLDGIQFTGDDGFATDLASFFGLRAGEMLSFSISLSSEVAGEFRGHYVLSFSDEDLPGAIDLAPLTLDVTGRIVAVPEPATLILLVTALVALGGWSRVRGRKPAAAEALRKT